MKPQASFNIDFDYALSQSVIIQITASVQLHRSVPHYHISNFHFKENPGGHSLLPDIDIMAVKEENNITWVHTDSFKETILSMAIGKAIEATGNFEIGYSTE